MTELPEVPQGPIEKAPGGFAPHAEQQRLLLEALDGVELGDYDRTIVRWLAGWDWQTVAPIVSLLRRVREAGRAEANDLLAAFDEALGVPTPAGHGARDVEWERLRLMECRVVALRVALAGVLVAGLPPAAGAVAVRGAVRESPATYPVRGEQQDRGVRRCPACRHVTCGDSDGPCGAILSATSVELQHCECTEGGGSR